MTYWTIETEDAIYTVAQAEDGEILYSTRWDGDTAENPHPDEVHALLAEAARRWERDQEPTDDPGERTEHLDVAQDETPLATDTDE